MTQTFQRYPMALYYDGKIRIVHNDTEEQAAHTDGFYPPGYVAPAAPPDADWPADGVLSIGPDGADAVAVAEPEPVTKRGPGRPRKAR